MLLYSGRVKEVLTRLLVEHRVSGDRIVLPVSWLKVLMACLRPFNREKELDQSGDVFSAIERISGIKQRDKAGSFIGARMGRPEKAAQREMSPPVNVLFPVGEAGGSSRDLIAATRNGAKAVVELANRRCEGCGETTWMERCPKCGHPTKLIGVCESCGLETGTRETMHARDAEVG